MIDPAYLGVITVGLLHGVEPGHGWPVAVLYSMRKKNRVLNAILSSGILGIGHLISSIAVVIVYIVLQEAFDFSAPWLKYAAAAVLVLIAVRLFLEKPKEAGQHDHFHEDQPQVGHEHEHEHPGGEKHAHPHKHTKEVALSLWGLASFAFLLGFAHEEEFALLALVAAGVNAWILMISYGVAVLLGLIAVTFTGVKIYSIMQPRLARFEKYVPKMNGGILLLLAIAIAFF
ncbi:MAG: nickel/cobalt transporter [Chloroflexi bacterium]|nr:nickel/cobalt transporter [Chloroflexota bacterium]